MHQLTIRLIVTFKVTVFFVWVYFLNRGFGFRNYAFLQFPCFLRGAHIFSTPPLQLVLVQQHVLPRWSLKFMRCWNFDPMKIFFPAVRTVCSLPKIAIFGFSPYFPTSKFLLKFSFEKSKRISEVFGDVWDEQRGSFVFFCHDDVNSHRVFSVCPALVGNWFGGTETFNVVQSNRERFYFWLCKSVQLSVFGRFVNQNGSLRVLCVW